MTSAQPKTIVIVEDEPDTAEMFGEMMRLSGYRVLKVYGGAPALSTIANEKPAAVVLDLMMPDLSGLEVLKFMRQDPSLDQTPVIVVTAKSLASDIRAGMEAGATVYLTKPVAFQELKAAVDQAIRTSVYPG